MIIKDEKNMGKIRAISISKTKKITATKKNFIQNGSRVNPLGSNPHSKGDPFSISFIVLKGTKQISKKKLPTNKQTKMYNKTK